MRWKKDTGQYANGKILYLGQWKVGGYHWNASRSRDDERKWCATCALPGMKKSLGTFEKAEEAAEAAEKAVSHWLAGSKEIEKGAA